MKRHRVEGVGGIFLAQNTGRIAVGQERFSKLETNKNAGEWSTLMETVEPGEEIITALHRGVSEEFNGAILFDDQTVALIGEYEIQIPDICLIQNLIKVPTETTLPFQTRELVNIQWMMVEDFLLLDLRFGVRLSLQDVLRGNTNTKYTKSEIEHLESQMVLTR